VWMSRETLPHVGNIKAFLWVMSKNMAIDAWRKVVNREAKLKQYLTESALEREDAEEINYFTLLDKAVAQLPPQQQKVYLLSRRHRMKQEEIANTMGISISTVKYYLQLSIAAITKQIKSDAGLSAAFFLLFVVV
ncbi:MAG TPA: sigma-70 family RNA polymerase sigma factor, partial [Parasegetibacter sp.]